MGDVDEAQQTTAQLELAAGVLLAPPSQVSHEQRREAEQLFIALQESRLAPSMCKFILECSTNEFVLFQVAKATSSSLLKDWNVTEPAVIEDCYKYMLEYVAARPTLASFVKRELLVCCAKVYKRGIFDHKAGDLDALCVTVEQLLASDQPHLQALGCELIEAVAVQFFSSWRSSGFGITWDFHLRAERVFETGGLKRLFQLALRMLQPMANADFASSSYHVNLCDKFLRVAEIILSWNFASRFLPPRLTYCVETTAGGALRPPVTWKEIFQNDDLLNLFFQLHGRVRSEESLSERSMNCLVQLASLMGDVLNAKEPTPADPYDHYLFLYVRNLLQLFQSGPLPSEVNSFCTIWYKLFNFHKVQSFVRFDDSFLSTMLDYMTQYAEHLAPIAMHNSLVDDEDSCRSALTNIYEAWLVMLRGFERSEKRGTLKQLTMKMLTAFMRSLLSEPFGHRIDAAQTESLEDIEQDDRERYADTLKIVGFFAVHCIAEFLPIFSDILKKKMMDFYGFVENGVEENALEVWREDMHWIMLLFGFILTEAEVDGTCLLPVGVYDYVRSTGGSPQAGMNFIRACIENPRAIPEGNDVNPVTRATGLILGWCSLEHSILVEAGATMVSPELMRSSLWVAKRLIYAESTFADGLPEYPPILHSGTDFSTFLIHFVFHKAFTILGTMSGEAKLCTDAADLLLALVDNRASEMAASEMLYVSLASLELDKLSVRRTLIHTLVTIGAAADSEQLQQRMYLSILQPLSDKFDQVFMDADSHDSDIADLLDCFAGVALAAQYHSAPTLFRFLSPILAQCVTLLSTRSKSELLTNSVLDLFASVTRKLSIHVDARMDSQFWHNVLLEMVETYRREHLSKYHNVKIEEEDKAKDLLLFLDILASIMSKDNRIEYFHVQFGGEPQQNINSISRTAIKGLEMLLPLMDENLLKLPPLCSKFYNLLNYFAEMSPEYLAIMSPPMFLAIMECIKRGLQCQFGQEIALISVLTLNELAVHYAGKQDSHLAIIQQLSALIEEIFTMCLDFSCEVDMFNEATFTLYSLICCNRTAFESLAMKLLSKEQNASARNHLEEAFKELLPESSTNTVVTRRHARFFRDHFEKFLSKTQGLLVLG